jgi:uncharacterized protein (DUF2235 family)
MRNVVVCCDGTWNTADQMEYGVVSPTNVAKIYNAILSGNPDPDCPDQIKYYHPGVGANQSFFKHLAGGIVGAGLDKIIMSAYQWLCSNYQPDDAIFLFGFSRGAFTARSLGGMISLCGLLDVHGIDDGSLWTRVEIAFNNGYRNHDKGWGDGFAFHPLPQGKNKIPIKFIGVWDTVGSLGIPDEMAILNLFDNAKSYRFHDTILGENVEYAAHGVSIDEFRSSFSPTLWTNIEKRPTVEQRWFPGEHGDVGGGRREHGLSDGALAWMISKAQVAGLKFKDAAVVQIHPNAQDFAHNPLQGVGKFMRTQPRNIPLLDERNASIIDDSVFKRRDNPPIELDAYRKTIQLAPGAETTLSVFAKQHWNETGIYCEQGATYEFLAKGQWLDGSAKYGPRGARDGKFRIVKIALLLRSLWGQIEKMFRKHADLRGTKRCENYPWMALVGVITNGGKPDNGGFPAPHETFMIGDGINRTLRQGSGYFCCFANDAWNSQKNNTGALRLTVKRKQ